MSKYKFHIDVLSFEDLMKYFITIQISPCLIHRKLLLEEGVIFEVSVQVILHKRKVLIFYEQIHQELTKYCALIHI